MITIGKIREYREFNSPHNTSFFILGVTTIGLFYLYCGYYSELSNFYLFTDIQYFPSISVWILVLALPYLTYGLYSQYKSLKNFDVVYIYKDRSLDAQKFGVVYLVWILICNIIFVSIVVLKIELVFFTPIIVYPGITFIIYTVLIFVLIIYGIVRVRKTGSEFSQELIAQRRAQVESIQNAPVRVQRSRSSRTSSSSSSRRRKERKPKPKQKSTSKTKRKRSQKPPKLSKSEKQKLFQKVQSMRPKTSNLTEDDFKCIFCFSLPQYPKDQGRGIILCPHCNYPAHADEFKDWVKSSKLCSRCGSEISVSFRRSPKIIPVKFYTKVIRYFRKKEDF